MSERAAQKVESIAFRTAGVPKGRVSVNADNAVVYLRGRPESDEQIEELVRATRAIEGVNGVKNKTASGADPLTGAPAPVDERQLRELSVWSTAPPQCAETPSGSIRPSGVRRAPRAAVRG